MKYGLRTVLIALLFFVLGCNSYFFQPTRQLYYPPQKFNLIHSELKFPSKDGTLLSAWFFPAQTGGKLTSSRGTIIQFHGNAENMSSHYTSLVWLTQQGYNLFAWDYRGYGISHGKASREGVYEDSLAALKRAIQEHDTHSQAGNLPVVLVGQSLGGAIAMRAYEDTEVKERIQLIVLDSTFSSYRDVAFKALSSNWITFIVSPLTYLLVTENKAPEQFWKMPKAPVVVVHDRKDPVVPYACGKSVFEKVEGLKEFWVGENAGHIRLLSAESSEVAQKFLKKLDSLKNP